MRLVGLVIIIVSGMLCGCQQASLPPVTGSSSPSGWEIRYNAAIGLARRGSDSFLDEGVQKITREMLDEQQQLSNFRTKLRDGKEVGDPAGARTAIIGALRAISEFRSKQPTADLSSLKPALEKLTQSANTTLAREAKLIVDQLKPSK